MKLPLHRIAGMVLPFFLFANFITHAQIIQTIAGNGTQGYSGDGGMATNAQFNYPGWVCKDNKGDVYITDYINNRVRKVDKAGIVTTVAGNGSYGYSGDGGLATAAQFGLAKIATDSAGNLYIADHGANRIRKVNVTTGVVTTIAGNGNSGSTGDGGPALQAAIETPVYVLVDKHGNIYTCSSDTHNVRKINAAGIITTIAGTGTAGYSGDGGPATAAQLNGPQSMALDDSDNLYIVDEANQRIRKINATTGIITTVIGSGTPGSAGDGGMATAAEIAAAQAVAVTKKGEMYLMDQGGARLRKVDMNGIITTVGGSNNWGYGGDDSLLNYAKFNHASDMAIDKFDNLYITDYFNQRVRKVTAPPVAMFTPNTGSICLDSCIEFINQSNSDSVNWYVTGTTVTDPHADTITVCFHQTGQVMVHLYVSNVSGADSTVDTFMVAPCTEAVGTVAAANFSIYPNPAGNEITIKNATVNGYLNIYDLTGRLVKKQLLTATRQSIDISSLQAGTYLLTCAGEKSVLLQKE